MPPNQDKLAPITKQLLTTLDLGPNYSSKEFLEKASLRMSEMFEVVFREADSDPRAAFSTTISYQGKPQIILFRQIEFYSMCEHHFLPFFGKIDLGYVPDKKIIGFRSIHRLIEILSKRPQLQERLTSSLASNIQEGLAPLGIAVRISARHLCSLMVTDEHKNFELVTSCYIGVFENQGSFRTEIDDAFSC